MEVTRIPDVETVRAIYADRVLFVIDHMQASVDQHIREAYATQLAALADEVMATGWSWRLCRGPDETRGLEFVPINERKVRNSCKPVERMTDRELLKHFANKVVSYDQARDEELDYLAKYPNRDAWTPENDAEYKEIMADIHARYGDIRKLIDHINKDRR